MASHYLTVVEEERAGTGKGKRGEEERKKKKEKHLRISFLPIVHDAAVVV